MALVGVAVGMVVGSRRLVGDGAKIAEMESFRQVRNGNIRRKLSTIIYDRAVILCDRDRPDGVGGLVGQTVAIDGAAYIVLKVDGRDPSRPVRRGETVALWVTAKAGC